MSDPDRLPEELAGQPSGSRDGTPAVPAETEAPRTPTARRRSAPRDRTRAAPARGEAEARQAAQGGRPPIEFDLTVVEGLGRIGATAYEMAHVLPASRSTIEHRMADKESDLHRAYHRGRSMLGMSLRRKQIQVAMAGNVKMLVWLGKQHLSQSDRMVVADIDLSACTDEQLERLTAGEDPMLVMGRWAPQ